jgi:hypothetical protein
LVILEGRVPPRSEVAPVFATVVFPVFGWSIIWFFERLPDWLPFLPLWDILSIFAYTQALALLESTLLLLFLIILASLLPAPWLRARFAVQGSAIAFMLVFWTILFQLIFEPIIRTWNVGEFILWFGLALISIILACVLVHRSRRLAKVVGGLADRMTVLLYIYVPLGLIGLTVVVLRNVL